MGFFANLKSSLFSTKKPAKPEEIDLEAQRASSEQAVQSQVEAAARQRIYPEHLMTKDEDQKMQEMLAQHRIQENAEETAMKALGKEKFEEISHVRKVNKGLGEAFGKGAKEIVLEEQGKETKVSRGLRR